MTLRSVLACAAVVLLVAAGPVAGVDPGLAPQPATDAEVEYDSTLIRIDLREDGSAAWTISYRVDLQDENATEAFDSLQEDIRANRSAFEAQFADRMNRTARAAENATGREMSIRNVTVSTSRDAIQQDGIVTYTFAWTDFASASNGTLRAGDAISGFELESGTTLFVSWPEGYGAVSISPNDPDQRSEGVAAWNGPTVFATDEPRLVLSTDAVTPTGTGESPSTDDGSTPGTTTTPGRSESGMNPLLVGLAGVVLVGLAAAAWYRRRGSGETASDAGGEPPAGGAGASTTTGGAGTATTADDAGRSGARDAAAGANAGATGSAEELLSNEERVLRLLEDNGGRMKQQGVVEELGWTDAKTSQVVGTLRDEEEIEVFRIGRENVLALPGETDL